MVVPKPNPKKEKLLKLMAEKDEIESKISSFGEILKNNDDVGMKGSLVDAQGFPRTDIDIYQVRQARQQIICLQNDHKALMKIIEELIHQLHAETAAEDSSNQVTRRTANLHLDDGATTSSRSEQAPTIQNGNANGSRLAIYQVIAKVNLVSPASPAEDSGLRLHDEIIEFGSINSSNFNNDLNSIGTLVRNMENQQIPLKIKRGNEILELILIPKTWSGRGLLGCNIILQHN